VSTSTHEKQPASPQAPRKTFDLERFFRLRENGTTVRTELMAGLTTFFATAFTILSIPGMIGGDDPELTAAVFIGATIASVFGTLWKSLYARIPFVQAPGMGLGAFFVGTVMPGLAVLAGNPDMPRSEAYRMGLALVFIAGALFLLTSFFGIRERIIKGIPKNIKIALGSGIGLFITLLGLRQAGITRPAGGTFVTLVNFSDFAPDANGVIWARGALIALFGLLVMGILAARKIKGAVLIGIIVAAIAAYVTGHASVPEYFSFDLGSQFSAFWNLSFFRLDFVGLFAGTGDGGNVFGVLLGMILVFALVNMLDALGTIFGISNAAGLVDDKGVVKGLKKGLTADAVGTAFSGLAGTSPTTTVVSSASGIAEGGRTGLTSLTTAGLFVLALFFAPFVALIPVVATAPALIYVGCLMMSNIKNVDFTDVTEAIPAFLAIAIMPLTFSIANGIAFALISYIVLKLAAGKWREISWVSVIFAALFVLQFVLG